nr:immunoglobulin light chain junction region [Macaca mulatta]MPO03095.1 immunoglobulin light chain junction region [Macaca mulatta]MPO03140.1 immunoglobulin light chain junction region [Macaca mulatta]MPO03150.1 immunoglobulin light chain junction region [Macaca mulatta]MPO03188.1 immunoglobulin light chain junction region [Macaca mulatta]
CSSYADSNVLF